MKLSNAPWSAFFCAMPVGIAGKWRLHMQPWELLGSVTLPGGDSLILRRRGEEFSLQFANFELMNSRQHDSEEQLATLGLAARGTLAGAHVLVGGLGMGYTLRAALDTLPADARVTVSELVPEVVDWNRDYLGHLAGEPLADPRVSVAIGDVADLLRRSRRAFDAVLIDIDNGPEADTHDDNNWLYSSAGLAATKASLKPGGVLTVWSTYPSDEFTRRLRRAGFDVDLRHVRSRGRKGNRHIIWVAKA